MFKKRIVVKYKGTIYDPNTGEKADVSQLKGAVIFNIDTASKNFSVKEKKEGGMPFVYKAKDGKWYMTHNLTPYYLSEVLYDYLGLDKSKGLVIESDGFLIAFLGKNYDVLFSKDPEERKAFLEDFFQGIDYKTISLDEAVKVVSPQVPLPLVIGVLVLFLVFAGYLGYTFFFGEDEVQTVNTAPPPPPPPPANFVAIAKTQANIDGLLRFPLKPYEYIDTIDFTSGTVTVASLIPQEGYQKNDNVFVKKEKLSKYAKDIKLTKSFQECNDILAFYGANLQLFDKKQAKYSLDKDMDIKKFAKFIYDLKGCPVDILGNAKITVDLRKESVNLKITTYRINERAYNSMIPRLKNL